MTEEASRRVVIESPGHLRVDYGIARERPAAGEVLLRTISVGICGSDLHVLGGHHPFVSYPVFPGHEVVGLVVGLGPKVDPAWRQARVVLEPSLSCGNCRACSRGRYNICESLRVMGFQAPGGMADHFVAPVARLHRVPDSLSNDAAVLVEPTAVAAHAVRRAGELAGSSIAIVGGGTIGLLCAQVARAGGASVTVVDVDNERLVQANSLGFTASGSVPPRAFDVVFECAGSEGALRSSIAATRKGGLVMLTGVHGREPRVQAGLIQDFELSLQGVLMYTSEDYRQAIVHLERGDIAVTRMIGERFPLAEAEPAFEMAARGGAVLKVLLLP